MRRRITVVVCALVALAMAGAPTAQAGKLRSKYRTLYSKVQHTHGKQAPGRNIVSDGVRTRRGVRPARAADLTASIGTLVNMLAPAPVVEAPANPQLQAQPSTVSSGGGAGGLPSCASESGGNYSTDPSNTNPSTGATGRYQEIPEHRQPGGLCYGIDLSPRGQDTCAGIIYAHQGAGAWTAC